MTDDRIQFCRQLAASLVKQKKYGEALSTLYELLSLTPDAAEVQAAIEQVKSHLVARYAKALGGLDGVAPSTPARAARSPEALSIERLANGRSSYEDILAASPLGRVRTLQLLCELYGDEAAWQLAYRARRRITLDFATPVLPRRPPSAAPVAKLNGTAQKSLSAPVHVPGPAASRAEAPAHESPVVRTANRESEFRAQFANGMKAYVARDYSAAHSAFSACLAIDAKHEASKKMLARVERETPK